MRLANYLLFGLILCDCAIAQTTDLPTKTFLIYVEKDQEIIEEANDVISLEPDAFNFVFEFSRPMGVLVHASFDQKTLKLAKKNKPFNKLPGFRQTGMADVMANPEKQVLLSEEAPNYWFYQSDSEHRFDKVLRSGNRIRCIRTIERILDTDAQASIEVEELSRPLHFVFISYERVENSLEVIEIQREFVTIKWENEPSGRD